MDNNFNQQQAQGQQPVYQQQMPQQQVPVQQMPAQQVPQQPMYQQMPAGQPVYQQAPKKPSNTNTKELLALICSGAGAFLAVLGSILTCSCSASKAYDTSNMLNSALGSLSSYLGGSSTASMDIHSMSAVVIVAILGAIVSAVGVVFGILAMKDKNATVKAGKMSYVAIAVGVFGVMYGILPMLTICGYNCSLNSNMTSALGL